MDMAARSTYINTSFNSNMVRLDVERPSPDYLERWRGFNSNMVRLDEKIVANCYPDGVVFQFQYGAIRCNNHHQFRRNQASSFNSNMVRLDVKPIDLPQMNEPVSIPIWCD